MAAPHLLAAPLSLDRGHMAGASFDMNGRAQQPVSRHLPVAMLTSYAPAGCSIHVSEMNEMKKVTNDAPPGKAAAHWSQPWQLGHFAVR